MSDDRLAEIKARWGEQLLQPNDSAIFRLPDDIGWLISSLESAREDVRALHSDLQVQSDATAAMRERAAKVVEEHFAGVGVITPAWRVNIAAAIRGLTDA